MGYTTYFDGQFDVTPTLSDAHREYLTAFSQSRRMRRNPDLLPPDPIREAAGLPAGDEGAYFVGAGGFRGQDSDPSVLDYNEPPGSASMVHDRDMSTFNERFNDYQRRKAEAIKNGAQPGLWCQWVPNDEGTAIVWDEGEKFYSYVEWIEYLIAHFLAPWGYKLNGEVRWVGEDSSDRGIILVADNVVKVGIAKDVYTFADGSTKED